VIGVRSTWVVWCVLSLLSASVSGASDSNAPQGAWRDTVRKFAVEHFKNPAWGYSHCGRDYTLARQLASADHARIDDDVLFAAAYLHDMAAFKPWADDKRDHSDVGAESIDAALKGTDFPSGKLDAVRAAIRTHMYYRDPVGPEATYLHDADALDWLGAIGIVRVIGLVDPEGGNPTGPDAIKMIEDNLKNVPAKVVSPAGRALIAARLAESRQFLQQLRAESNNLADL
jgi:HD superfamily phosphodiesterase